MTNRLVDNNFGTILRAIRIKNFIDNYRVYVDLFKIGCYCFANY